MTIYDRLQRSESNGRMVLWSSTWGKSKHPVENIPPLIVKIRWHIIGQITHTIVCELVLCLTFLANDRYQKQPHQETVFSKVPHLHHKRQSYWWIMHVYITYRYDISLQEEFTTMRCWLKWPVVWMSQCEFMGPLCRSLSTNEQQDMYKYVTLSR